MVEDIFKRFKIKKDKNAPIKHFPFQSFKTTDKAKIIRKILKQAHPETKFSVRSKRTAINVDWTESVSVKTVKKLQLWRYNYPMRDGRGGTTSYDYLFLNRKIRPETYEKERRRIESTWNKKQWAEMPEYRKQEMAYRSVWAKDLPNVPKVPKFKKPKRV